MKKNTRRSKKTKRNETKRNRLKRQIKTKAKTINRKPKTENRKQNQALDNRRNGSVERRHLNGPGGEYKNECEL